MHVLVIGSNGKVGRRLVLELVNKKFHVRAMVRSENQMEYIKKLGAEPYLADLEEDFSSVLSGMDIVIFTAGSGGHTGPDKTIDVDQNAAIRSIELALKYKIQRYIMISAQGARNPEIPSKIQHYYKAKRIADDYLIKSGINYTIFRPGRLTDEAGTGMIQAAEFIGEKGITTRDNLARAIVLALNSPNTTNKVIEILEGNTPIEKALNKI